MPRGVHEFDPEPGSPEYVAKEYQDAFRLGRELETFCNQHPVGEYLVARANQELQDGINAMLREDDLTTQTARSAHFKARVAMGVLAMIDDAVKSGREAEAVIAEHEASSE